MSRLQAINVLTLYALAIAACSVNHPKGGGAGSAGRKPTAGGMAGTGGAEAIHDCFTNAPANPNDPKACTGGFATWTGKCAARSEQQDCYVSEVTNGSLNCLPPDAPNLLGRIQDEIASIGFLAEFVIDAAPDRTLSDNCEPLLACCNQVDDGSQRDRCYDRLDNPDYNETMSSPCNNFDLSTRMRWCPAGSDSADSDGGATTTSVHGKYGLCCYRTCGHSHAN